MKLEHIQNFIFNDGIKEIDINGRYDNWLTSIDYNDYSKAFIQIDKSKINLFDNSKELIEGKDFNLEELETISKKFDLILDNNQICYKCFTKSHSLDRFYIIQKDSYTIIFSLGGTKSFESIYLYGIWKGYKE